MLKYLRKYSHYFFRHKRAVAIGIICLILTNVFAATKPMILKFAIDDLEQDINDSVDLVIK